MIDYKTLVPDDANSRDDVTDFIITTDSAEEAARLVQLLEKLMYE